MRCSRECACFCGPNDSRLSLVGDRRAWRCIAASDVHASQYKRTIQQPSACDSMSFGMHERVASTATAAAELHGVAGLAVRQQLRQEEKLDAFCACCKSHGMCIPLCLAPSHAARREFLQGCVKGEEYMSATRAVHVSRRPQPTALKSDTVWTVDEWSTCWCAIR